MTAFDNIKVNNWPATSNDLEDFLVLEMPLNDNASLTESLPVVAGSKELFPKRTLANTGVSTLAAGSDWNASSGGSNYNGTWDNVFNGAATATSSTQGASYWMYAYNQTMHVNLREPISGKIEILAGLPGSSGSGTHSITLSAGSTDVVTTTLTAAGASNYQWYDFGNRSNIDKITVQGGDPGVSVWAVRLNNIVLVNPTGGPKKHYDNNADFGTSSQDTYLTIPASSDFSFGTGPWCIECWAYIRSAPTNGTAIWDFNTSAGYTNEEWISAYTYNGVVWFYWGHSGYEGINANYTANQWQHWAWTWDGTTARLFRDGTVAVSTTTTNKSAGWGSATRNITIGKQNYDSPNRFGDQQIQDLRIYKGTAKYTANFTPPGAILG